MKFAAAFIFGVIGLSVKASNFDAPTIDENYGKNCFRARNQTIYYYF